jgi:hypothetical protein
MHNNLIFILFWNNALHVSDCLSIHHQESETVHTASGMYHTGSVAACFLLLMIFVTVGVAFLILLERKVLGYTLDNSDYCIKYCCDDY